MSTNKRIQLLRLWLSHKFLTAAVIVIPQPWRDYLLASIIAGMDKACDEVENRARKRVMQA